VHAVALTGVTSLLQFHFGNVDFRLVGALVIGSIPGDCWARISALAFPSLGCGVFVYGTGGDGCAHVVGMNCETK